LTGANAQLRTVATGLGGCLIATTGPAFTNRFETFSIARFFEDVADPLTEAG
jgi:hypothetical protein